MPLTSLLKWLALIDEKIHVEAKSVQVRKFLLAIVFDCRILRSLLSLE